MPATSFHVGRCIARSRAALPRRVRSAGSCASRARAAPRPATSPGSTSSPSRSCVCQVRQVAGAPADDRQAYGHRLAVDRAERLLQAGQDKRVSGRVQRRNVAKSTGPCTMTRPRRSPRARRAQTRRAYGRFDLRVADEVQRRRAWGSSTANASSRLTMPLRSTQLPTHSKRARRPWRRSPGDGPMLRRRRRGLAARP